MSYDTPTPGQETGTDPIPDEIEAENREDAQKKAGTTGAPVGHEPDDDADPSALDAAP